jgi:hypothetical protein
MRLPRGVTARLDPVGDRHATNKASVAFLYYVHIPAPIAEVVLVGLARLVFYVPDQEKEWWDDLSQSTHLTKIEILRVAIDEYVSHHYPEFNPRPKESK